MALGYLDLARVSLEVLPMDEETLGLMLELAEKYKEKNDLIGAKVVYRHILGNDPGNGQVRALLDGLE